MLALLTACLPSTSPSSLQFKVHQKPSINPASGEVVTFEELKTKVLGPKCLACHAKWKDEVGFQAKHITIGDPDHSKMFDSVKSARMPKGAKLPDGAREPVVPLSTAELELFYNYIQNAKKITVTVTFEELNTRVIAPKCLACHKKWIDEPAFLLKYVTPGDAEKSKMYLSVKNEKMPKSPKNPDGTPGKVIPLSNDDQELIRNYINGIKIIEPGTNL
jgi:hypothetical protein